MNDVTPIISETMGKNLFEIKLLPHPAPAEQHPKMTFPVLHEVFAPTTPINVNGS